MECKIKIDKMEKKVNKQDHTKRIMMMNNFIIIIIVIHHPNNNNNAPENRHQHLRRAR
jgi:hypothetical protein